jgi:hypothetical protein
VVAALEVKALYSLAALAHAAGVTRYLMLRILRANNVTFIKAGRSLFVSVSEVEARIPAVWRAILAAEGMRAQAVEAARRA